MIMLVSGATATLRTLPASSPIGHLLTPRMWLGGFKAVLETGRPVAADNDCFQRLDPGAYRRMVETLAPHRDRVLWVTVPDVVGNHRATRRRWHQWLPFLRHHGMRAAYVAQDGETAPPWDDLDCLFIGGTTTWKEGEAAINLCRAARERGKWVHVGRVNTVRRLRMFDAVADSFDGTQFSRFPAAYIPRWMEILAYRQEQLWSA